MVSVAVIEECTPDKCEPSSEQQHDPLYPEVRLWRPSPPCRTRTILNSEIPEDQAYRCMMNMDFGDPAGENLKYLTRVVAHVHSYHKFITGLTFDYLHTPSVRYGRPGNLEVSFLIGGLNGERIVAVAVEHEIEWHAMRSVRVSSERPTPWFFKHILWVLILVNPVIHELQTWSGVCYG
jgi:hypothetical protein